MRQRANAPRSNSPNAASSRRCAAATSPYSRPRPTTPSSAVSSAAPSQVELFDARGSLRSRLSYVAGKRVRSEELYDNGKPAALDEMVGNQRIEQNFSSEGVKRREMVSLLGERGAIRQREQAFSEQGDAGARAALEQRGIAAERRRASTTTASRAASRYTAWTATARLVEITEFHDSGQRAAIGRYLANDRLQPDAGRHPPAIQRAAALLHAPSRSSTTRAASRASAAGTQSGELEREDEVFEDGSRKGKP